MLIFSTVTLLVTYLVQRVQQYLPLNPQGLDTVSPPLAFNTADQLHHQHELAELLP